MNIYIFLLLLFNVKQPEAREETVLSLAVSVRRRRMGRKEVQTPSN
jgi:hypothetical protein